MATMSVRGLDDQALERLKRQAEREGCSLNSVVLRTLGGKPASAAASHYDDLDALAGTWSAAQAREFERRTAPFAEVDPALWKP